MEYPRRLHNIVVKTSIVLDVFFFNYLAKVFISKLIFIVVTFPIFTVVQKEYFMKEEYVLLC